MQLNGFQIERYNVHNIPEGVKYYTCPLCSAERKKKTQKCLSVFWDTGIAKCSHCGEVVQLHSFKRKSNSNNYKIPVWKNSTKLSDDVVKWFEKRKISQFVLRLMKIGEGLESMPHKGEWKKKNTIQFPYFRNGQIVDVKYRSGDKNFKLFKEAERITYNLDNIQSQEIIYCVEGEPDVLAVMECGIHNVCSPPNGFTAKGNVNLDWLNNDVEHFVKAKKLILAFDNDTPGDNGKKEFIRRFGGHKCYVVDLKDCKDSNDFLIKYGSDELKKALENHIELPLENVSTYNDCKEKVRDFFLNGMPRGLITGNLGGLDENFSTNTSQTILVTGIPSCFTANQKIITCDGVKKISKLKKGDKVLSYNENKKLNEYNAVVNALVNKNTNDKIYRLTMKDGTIIECTENHRFYNGTSYVKIKELLLSLDKFNL